MTMPTRLQFISAVLRRNFAAYFTNPTGYVFITVFILLGAIAAFWQDAFFLGNLANLDQLNALFPTLLLFFIPALTMNVWAEERRFGTDELLLTLPGRDIDIVLGKYLAVLGIYTVATLFSLSHLLVLIWLGTPDLGLMFATYFGYWISGAALLAVGMVASQLTSNGTVAFIVGAMMCAALVYIHLGEGVLPSSDALTTLGFTPNFAAFGDGLISVSSTVYFVALAAVMLYANVVILGTRHAPSGQAARRGQYAHSAIRMASLIVVGLSATIMVHRAGASLDTTAERLHSLQPRTLEIIEAIPEDRPVFVQAFISPDVPEAFVQVRKDLVNLLKRFDREGGDRIRLTIHETEPFTDIAATAATNYNIAAVPVGRVESGRRASGDIFLGVVFQSGPEEFVIPFFDRGLPVEYELARSVRVVTQESRKKVGVVATDASPFGGFDFETMQSRRDWSIITELRKQYDVVQVQPAGPYPDDIDALVVILPSGLAQPEMDTLEAAIMSGTPTLLLDDPLPVFNTALAPALPKDAGRNPFSQQNQAPAPPKGDLRSIMGRLGLSLANQTIIWSEANPHPNLADVDPEVVFVYEASHNDMPFSTESEITDGLQELVMLFPGFISMMPESSRQGLALTPLLRSGRTSGETAFASMVQQSFFGINMNPNPRRLRTNEDYVLAMQVTGKPPFSEDGDDAAEVNVIVVADADIVSETFFNLRRQGMTDLNFDNVTFALNCIDMLAGDESFVALRKHRPQHRTLTRVEELSKGFTEQRLEEAEAAESAAQAQLDEAQERLDERVAALEQRDDIDEQTKTIMLRSLRQTEQRRLDVQEATITQEKDKRIALAETEMITAIGGVQRNIRWMATLIPPIPTFLLAVFMFIGRYQREKAGISERQLVGASK